MVDGHLTAFLRGEHPVKRKVEQLMEMAREEVVGLAEMEDVEVSVVMAEEVRVGDERVEKLGC